MTLYTVTVKISRLDVTFREKTTANNEIEAKKSCNFIHVIYEEVFESRSLRLEYKFTFQIVFVYGDKTILMFGSFYRSCTFKFSPSGLQGEKNLFAPARQVITLLTSVCNNQLK